MYNLRLGKYKATSFGIIMMTRTKYFFSLENIHHELIETKSIYPVVY
ncbi:hypothetical protein [Bacillus pumilus]